MSLIINPSRFAAPPAAGATPSYVGSTPVVKTTGAATIDFSATGRQSGDFLFIMAVGRRETVSVTTPGGWTKGANRVSGSNAASDSVEIFSYHKISDGTETTIGLTDLGSFTIAVGGVVRDVNATDPINTQRNNGFSSGSTQNHSGQTTTVDNCLVLGMLGYGDNETLISANNTALDNFTTQVFDSTTLGADGSVIIVTGELPIAGATGTTTIVTSTSVRSSGVFYAIAPV